MSNRKVTVSEKVLAYSGYLRLDQYKLKHSIFGSGMSMELSREVLERGHAAAVLPYDPVNDELVLIEQFRIGGYTSPQLSPWQIECIAGIIEPQQSATDAARRESKEEGNLEILDLEPIHTYLSSPGCTSETVHLFCGRVDASSAGGVHGLEEEGEYIKVFKINVNKAFSILNNGMIENGMTIIALQWLFINLEKIKLKWKSAGE